MPIYLRMVAVPLAAATVMLAALLAPASTVWKGETPPAVSAQSGRAAGDLAHQLHRSGAGLRAASHLALADAVSGPAGIGWE